MPDLYRESNRSGGSDRVRGGHWRRPLLERLLGDLRAQRIDSIAGLSERTGSRFATIPEGIGDYKDDYPNSLAPSQFEAELARI